MRALASLLFLSACASPSEQWETGRQPIIGGAPATGPAAVVAIGKRPTACGARPIVECSGAVISSRAVLTAAHCVDQPGLRSVFIGDRLDGPGAVVDVAAVHVHPEWVPDGSRNDVAIMVLDAPVSVAPLPTSTTPLTEASAIIYGFGAPRAGRPPDGIKRRGQSAITSIDTGSFRLAPGPDLICNGDSGGPVTVIRDGREILIGITAEGDVECAKWSRAEDVVSHASFLAAALRMVDTAPRLAPAADACARDCVDDDQCPVGHECQLDDRGVGRCALAPLPIGALGSACTSAAQCGGAPCTRVLGSEACRCLVPCSGRTTIRAGGGGCAIERAEGDPLAALSMVVVTALALRWAARA